MRSAKMFFAPFACGKSELVARCDGVSTIPGRARKELLPGGAGAAKVWNKKKLLLRLLQVLEIPQNHQRNVWKSLEEKGANLEVFAEKAWRPSAAGAELDPMN
jgi:hypothetical protein